VKIGHDSFSLIVNNHIHLGSAITNVSSEIRCVLFFTSTLYNQITMKAIKALSFFLITSMQLSFGQDLHWSIDTSRASIKYDEGQQAKKIAVDFTNCLFLGSEADSLLAMCALPFAIDGELFADSKTLRAKFIEITKETKKNQSYKIKVDSTIIFGTRKDILNGLIPLNTYFVLNTVKGEINGQSRTTIQIAFAVQVSDKSKIIGITAE